MRKWSAAVLSNENGQGVVHIVCKHEEGGEGVQSSAYTGEGESRQMRTYTKSHLI